MLSLTCAPAASAAAVRDADVLERVTQAAGQTELERLRAMLDRARSHGYMLRAACIALASCLVVAGYALARQDTYAKQVTLAAISASSVRMRNGPRTSTERTHATAGR